MPDSISREQDVSAMRMYKITEFSLRGDDGLTITLQ